MGIEKEIVDSYKLLRSMKAVVRETGYSWYRVRKTLSSNGIIVNDTHRMILDLHDRGMSPEEIANQLSISVKIVQSYLPRVRPVYGENRSKNAESIKRWREEKKKTGSENC